MKITVAKIKRELIANHRWDDVALEAFVNKALVDELLKDTLIVIDEILMKQKGISIR